MGKTQKMRRILSNYPRHLYRLSGASLPKMHRIIVVFLLRYLRIVLGDDKIHKKDSLLTYSLYCHVAIKIRKSYKSKYITIFHFLILNAQTKTISYKTVSYLCKIEKMHF